MLEIDSIHTYPTCAVASGAHAGGEDSMIGAVYFPVPTA
jgi:hypothetical protein